MFPATGSGGDQRANRRTDPAESPATRAWWMALAIFCAPVSEGSIWSAKSADSVQTLRSLWGQVLRY